MERRGGRGVREVAEEIGVSSATLSRVERGNLPDIETFTKICRWLKVDPADILDLKEFAERPRTPGIAAHFRADQTLDPLAAADLAQLLLLAQQAFAERQ